MNETTDRPAHWPDADDPVLVAARTLDTAVDAGADLPTLVADLGLNLDTLEHLAMQRIARAREALGPDVEAAPIIAAMIDGLCIGWEARKVATGAYGVGAATAAVDHDGRVAYVESLDAQEAAYWEARHQGMNLSDKQIGDLLRVAAPHMKETP